MDSKKRVVNVNYAKARIKPFLNPLFWGSSFIIVVFFYGLWQYTQNPDIFSGLMGSPSESPVNKDENAGVINDTQQSKNNQQPLTDDELSALADVDNIDNLLQENQLNPVEKKQEKEQVDLASEIATNLIDFNNFTSFFEEVNLNPGEQSSQGGNNQNKPQNNFFQQYLKPDNVMGNNSLVNTRNQENTPKIDVIRPPIQLPTLQDLTTRQRNAVEEYKIKQTLQNQLTAGGNTGVNSVNTPITLERSLNPQSLPNANYRNNTIRRVNPNPVPNLNPVMNPNPVINPNPVPNLNRVPNVTGFQSNTNSNTITNNFSPINPQIPQININPNLTGINTNPAPINNNINNNSLVTPAPQEPVRNQSGFLYYY